MINEEFKESLAKEIICSLIDKDKFKLYNNKYKYYLNNKGKDEYFLLLDVKNETIKNIEYEILVKVAVEYCSPIEINVFSTLFGYCCYCYDISKTEYLSIKENIVNDLGSFAQI